jgi:hypothetical protein
MSLLSAAQVHLASISGEQQPCNSPIMAPRLVRQKLGQYEMVDILIAPVTHVGRDGVDGIVIHNAPRRTKCERLETTGL